MDTLTLTRPDDWHLHVRDGALLQGVLPHTVRQFRRAIIMPNLKPPVRTVAEAGAYRDRILAAVPSGARFEPLMTLYLTETTPPAEIAAAQAAGFVKAVKYYPAGATTNSDAGVRDLRRCDAVFAAMEAAGLPLLLHGEVTDPTVDVFEREKAFIAAHLQPLRQRFPQLKIVFEHITTADAVEFVQRHTHTAATITPQHLLYNRNSLFKGGIRPHVYCLPILKHERHRHAIVQAATSGDPKFFLGTDSAPHPRHRKESDCGCAGCYSALHALELYAEAFEAAGALAKLEAFASFHGPDFYGLPRNTDTITLTKTPWQVPAVVALPEADIVPLRAGETMDWQLVTGASHFCHPERNDV